MDNRLLPAHTNRKHCSTHTHTFQPSDKPKIENINIVSASSYRRITILNIINDVQDNTADTPPGPGPKPGTEKVPGPGTENAGPKLHLQAGTGRQDQLRSLYRS